MKLHKTIFALCSVALFLFIAVCSALALEGGKGDAPQTGQLPPPRILSPADRSEIRAIFKMPFSWSDVPKAAGYHIVLAKDRKFRNIVYENVRVTETSCIAENLSYGTYFYRISSIAENGAEGPFSEVRTFVIVPSPPPLK